MKIKPEKFEVNGKDVVIRCPRPDEAAMVLDYYKTVSGETRYLLRASDEINYTVEQEKKYIDEHNKADDQLMLLAFIDGDYAGNCTFKSMTGSRRLDHRAEISIALFQKHTGEGLGRIMLNKIVQEVKNAGFEQVELAVVEGNDGAYHLYESVGFKECGRIPNANKYKDGTYADDILMVKDL